MKVREDGAKPCGNGVSGEEGSGLASREAVPSIPWTRSHSVHPDLAFSSSLPFLFPLCF